MTNRLTSLGEERWTIHFESRRRVAAGEDVIELTIGEPDVPVPPHLIDVAETAMRAGRTRYSGGRGDPVMIEAIAKKYSKRTGRSIGADHVLCLPGTQAALTVAVMSLVETGDAVLVPDPYYATYEGVVRLTGADFIPVPMDAANNFRLTAEQVEAAVTPNTKVLLLNSPHNPTGATLSADEIALIGAVCERHNLWIVSDEVYEHLVFDDQSHHSVLQLEGLRERSFALFSFGKTYSVTGWKTGYCVAPPGLTEELRKVYQFVSFVAVTPVQMVDLSVAKACTY